jgi:hypothetical protein
MWVVGGGLVGDSCNCGSLPHFIRIAVLQARLPDGSIYGLLRDFSGSAENTFLTAPVTYSVLCKVSTYEIQL